MTNVICLDEKYSTTRLLIQEKLDTMDDSKGGLRESGYFKKSYEGKPLISIITVVYNAEKYIEETIQSVINQTYDNVEYIIIDGGSTDGTLDIIKKYKDKIDYLVSEKDNGIYDAMNKGINVVSGEWINFMNAGDTFCDHQVISQVFDTTYSSSDVIYGNTVVIDNRTKLCRTIKPDAAVPIHLDKPYCHQSCFFRKNAMPYFDISYTIAADYKQYLEALAHNKRFKYINLNVSNFLAGGVSYGKNKSIFEKYRANCESNCDFSPLNKIAYLLYYIPKHVFSVKLRELMDI